MHTLRPAYIHTYRHTYKQHASNTTHPPTSTCCATSYTRAVQGTCASGRRASAASCVFAVLDRLEEAPLARLGEAGTSFLRHPADNALHAERAIEDRRSTPRSQPIPPPLPCLPSFTPLPPPPHSTFAFPSSYEFANRRWLYSCGLGAFENKSNP